ncbi:ATP-binding cassette domain-containing protein [Mesorhizobium sp. LHD-90]|uniref:ATP-binding cassette domain-containing protein n=1 Tax=Mesorhizobium sp. LHD-90 TaxID=3071414 RepID=UPI0027DF5634|nr:ATP-binding cassette domain-containing protein [Mesorhizobium sp. LHD-90]MDQ6435613.1 ATP-binding cassette domain-containing protein [Mesorhizobium sp. LHD-90]
MLNLINITKSYPRKGLFGRGGEPARVVDDVSFSLQGGRTFGLIGESGSGKSTLARIALRLVDPTSGTVLYRGEDITGHAPSRLMAFRREVQPVFQSASGALDPRMRVAALLEQPLVIAGGMARSEREDRVAAALRAVELPADFTTRLPRTLSGGQRQRIGIARALITEPKVLILDEPVSALDVSVQAQILNLLKDIQQARGLSYLFIGHDLAVARFMCDEIAVLERGRLVERGPADQIVGSPDNAYTKGLLEASRWSDHRG